MKASGKTTRYEKRELGEIDESRKASRVFSPDTTRPSKSRKTTYQTITTTRKDRQLVEDDPVSLARKALEMFQKEVEDDEDDTGPDKLTTSVEVNEESRDSRSTDGLISSTKMKDTNASFKSSSGSGQLIKPSSKQIDKGPTSAWQKASRVSMFSDDPSIL